MDDAALHDLAMGAALNGLDRAAFFTDLIAGADDPKMLLGAKLAPHMFDCAEQITTSVSFTQRMVMPVIGRNWSLKPDGKTLDDLRVQISNARAQLKDVGPGDFAGKTDATIHHRAGHADLAQTGRDYLMHFAIPNMWFHLSMAYAILRGQGFAIGKADFDGLHVYAPGFHWV